jgi:integral membrane sensor domain MASE1
VENAAVGILIYLSVVLMREALVSDHIAISPVWPAPGFALAAALLLGWRVAPGIFIPVSLGSIGAGNPWIFSLLAPLGLVGSSYLGRFLLGWRGFNTSLSTTKDILLLAGFGAGIPMAIAGFWTASCLWFAGQINLQLVPAIGSIYWVANTAGSVVVAPVLLIFASAFSQPSPRNTRRLFPSIAQVALLVGLSWFAFFGSKVVAGYGVVFAYLPFPILVWIALSRGLSGAAVGVVVVVLTAAIATGQGVGPFALKPPLAAFWHLEVFIAVLATSGFLIGAGSDAQRREKALQAEAATRKAELERLKAQVNPHFLFNCLTAIQSLVRTDSAAAGEGLGALSSLLRKSLDVAKHPLIPLGEELEIIRDALRLQKMRYEEGLEWSVGADKEAEEFRVPPMILQPLVENAVKHGVCDGFGRVDLSAVVKDGDLIVNVRNTAPDDSDPAKWQDSVGLASVRARIEEACPPGSGVEFTKTPERWIQALVRIKGQNRGSET